MPLDLLVALVAVFVFVALVPADGLARACTTVARAAPPERARQRGAADAAPLAGASVARRTHRRLAASVPRG